MVNIGLIVLAFISSYFFVGTVRKRAIQIDLIDVPNERSSHTIPTPTGGGLGFVISVMILILYLTISQQLDNSLGFALLGGGSLVAINGYWDDHHSLPILVRLLTYCIAAIWGIFWIGPITQLDLGVMILDLGVIGTPLSIVGVVWLLNLFNFMDGIDGLAGSEAVFVASAAGLLLFISNQNTLALVSFILASSCLGFLLWNWPNAKIFMGDVGSVFLGYVFGMLAIYSHQTTEISIWIWTILLGIFIVDATVTIVRRLLRGEKFYRAHRSHAYQHLATHLESHLKVTLLIIVINLVVLLPLAVVVFSIPDLLLPVTGGTATLFVVVALYFGAGSDKTKFGN